jgi:hypothetical protein
MTDKLTDDELLDKAIDDAMESSGVESSEEDIEVDSEEVSSDEEVPEEEEASEDTETEPEQSAESEMPATEVTDEPELDPILPPSSLKPEAKEAFSKAPRVLQEDMHRVLLDSQRYLTKVSQEAAELRRTTEGVFKAFEPYQERLRLSGQNPEQVVGTMLAWDHMFKEDPVNAIVEAANKTGVDLYQFAQQILGGGIQQPDPQYLESQRQIQELEQRLREREERDSYQAQTNLELEADAFLSETSPSGTLLRPYAQNEEVLQEMVLQIQVIRQANPKLAPRQILHEAYNRAIRVNDSVQSDIKRAEQAKLAKKQKIEDAKKSSKVVKQTGSYPSGNSGFVDIDDAIDQAMDVHFK